MFSKLKRIIANSSRIVFFGGAGVSTESGIPDFRSEKGLYKTQTRFGRSPDAMLSHSFFVKHPEEFFAFRRENLIFQNAKPNEAHKALVRLEEQGNSWPLSPKMLTGCISWPEGKRCTSCMGPGFEITALTAKHPMRWNIPSIPKNAAVQRAHPRQFPDVMFAAALCAPMWCFLRRRWIKKC